MAFWRQFRLVLWKNYLLQRRKLCVTIFEVLLPVVFAVLVVVIRSTIKTNEVDTTTVYDPEVLNASFARAPRAVGFLYAPDNPSVQSLMNDVSAKLKLPGQGFKDEEALLENYRKLGNLSVFVFGGVILEGDFPSTGGIPNDVTLKIRPTTSSKNRWNTRLMFPFFQSNAPRSSSSPDYKSRGFLSMQYAIVTSIIDQLNGTKNLSSTNLYINRMPYPPYHNDPFLTVLQQYFPLILMLSFIFNALQNTKNMVYEKERKLKESMKMMGLSNFAHYSAWFFKCFLYLLVAMVIYTLLFIIPVGEINISVLGQCDPSVFFVYLILYAISIVAFCFVVSVFFSKANIGAAAGGILFFVSYFPYFFLQSRYEMMTLSEKMAACLLPNVAMAFGANVIGLFEGTGEGAQWTNLHKPATVDDNFTLLLVMVMLLVDTAICFLITWYVDAVFPGEFGVSKPWYFPILKSYWCGSGTNSIAIGLDTEKGPFQNTTSNFFEREPTGLTAGIQIKNLRKEFGSGESKKVAVAGTSLNMYRGQITALLGHNGAGKTTTMSMLTGFLPPTNGTAIVNGYDIRTDIDDVRKTLGLCPQHDILFDTLTVREHMVFFAKLKGCPDKEVDKEVEDLISVVGLAEKHNAQSMTLSGGQKRKLSVAIALVAGSEIVILDEPTSGMDPQARRQMWTILQNFRSSRTILLTTHYMDEADVLGDRIAIMAEGVVKCCGTSLFLKKKYGSGYHLTLVKTPSCDVTGITKMITSHIPKAINDGDVGAELTYVLPNEESHKFEQLFADMESNRNRLGFNSYGVSVTTMEEVFLRVGEGATDDPEMMNQLSKHGDQKHAHENGDTKHLINGAVYTNMGYGATDDFRQEGAAVTNLQTEPSVILNFNQDLRKNRGISLSVQQFRAAFVKKVIHTWRNRVITTVQLLLPIVFTILALIVEKTTSIDEKEPAITLDMSHFRDNTVSYSADLPGTDITKYYESFFKGTSSKPTRVNLSEYDDMVSYYEDIGRDVGVAPYNQQYLVGADFQGSDIQSLEATAFYNGQPYHSIAISTSAMLDSLLKLYNNASSVTTINYPLPESIESDPNSTMAGNMGIAFTIAFCILFGMAFLASSFVMFIIKERSTRSKHIQIVCGLKRVTYWVANFTWDYINYIIPCLCLIVVFVAFNTEAYAGDRLGYVFFILVLYGWAILPFVYIFHFVFSTAASGVVALIILNIFTGLATLMAVFIMSIPDFGLVDAADALGWLFSIFLPNYCLGQSFMNVFLNHFYLSTCTELDYEDRCITNPLEACCVGTCEGDFCFKFYENYFEWKSPGIGRYVLFMALQGVFYSTLVLLVDYGVIRRIWYLIRPPPEFSAEMANREEDSDVAAEKERVEYNGIETLSLTESLVLYNVTKSYDGYVAVERLSLGVPQNECFGLLGVNGAGKTSTFKMLTGDEIISDGTARLNGNDVKTQLTKVQSCLGYCPQFDALIDQMTGRETLTMFARLKGIQEERIPSAVTQLMKILTLEEYADKLSGQYSGGNKRKLSTGISLIGDPPVIFLDEPTTGVDPAARRQLWNVLSEIRASGRTLILTSHSMEECDALCTRVAIMVNGRFLCLGSPQHLKNKFGQGYSLIARISEDGDESRLEHFLKFIETKFPQNQRVDAGNGYVNYHLTDSSMSLAYIFGTLERAKDEYHIEDYSVSQTTLQQVFIDFARKQVPPREDKSGGCCKSLCSC